jgi:AcrR family transcriptional regulator
MNPAPINLESIETHLSGLIVSRARHLFMKVGVKSVSMDDIAAECGMSKKTIYGCFDKKSLVKAVTKQQIGIFASRTKSIFAGSGGLLQEMTGLLLLTLDAAQEISFQFLHSIKTDHAEAHQSIESFSAFIQKALIDNLKRGKEEGFYRDDMEPSIVVQLYFAQLREIIEQPITRPPAWTEELYKLFLFGVLTVNGKAELEGLDVVGK